MEPLDIFEEVADYVSIDDSANSALKLIPNQPVSPPYPRLQPLKQSGHNAILMFPELFYPPTNYHSDIIKESKAFAEACLGYSVLGMIAIPLHRSALKRVFGKLLLTPEKRHHMVKLWSEAQPDCDFEDYLLVNKSNMGIDMALSVIKKKVVDYYEKAYKHMNPRKKKAFEFIFIGAGLDSLERLWTRIDRGLIIILQSELNNSKIQEKIEQLSIRSRENLKLVFAKGFEREIEYFSKKARVSQNASSFDDNLDLLTRGVLDYHVKENLKYEHEFPENQQTLENKSKREEVIFTSLKDILNFPYNEIPFEELAFTKDEQGADVVLGAGVQAKVYLMKWRQKEFLEPQEVAVKVYDCSEKKYSVLKIFRHDLRGLLASQHKNTVKCMGAGFYKSSVYIVMERATEEKNLWLFLQTDKKLWPAKQIPKEFVKALAGLADALDNMAGQGILHRDLHLKNILIFRDSQACKSPEERLKGLELKISDFGLSATEADKDQIVRGSTRHYAPEAMIHKNNYIPQSDVFSFGNLLWEFIHHRKVWSQFSVGQTVVKVCSGQRLPITVNCDELYKNTIFSCWEQDPDKRPSFKKIAAELRSLSDKLA